MFAKELESIKPTKLLFLWILDNKWDQCLLISLSVEGSGSVVSSGNSSKINHKTTAIQKI